MRAARHRRGVCAAVMAVLGGGGLGGAVSVAGRAPEPHRPMVAAGPAGLRSAPPPFSTGLVGAAAGLGRSVATIHRGWSAA